MNKPVFPIRLLYATSDRQREKAAEIGCNWALVYTHAHRRNDFPVYFESEPRIARLRRQSRRMDIELERALLRHAVNHAHGLGLKAMIHSYELSLPPETRSVYPGLYRPEVKEYRAVSRTVRQTRMPCLADPRVRDLLSRRVAETVALVPDLDAYSFSFNECLSLTKVRHRCELCRDIPFARMIKWLADAVSEGARSVNPAIKVFHRLWGVNEHDDVGYKNFVRRYEFAEGQAEEWLPGYIKAYKPASMQYRPSRDLPRYLALQKEDDIGFIVKGTWADVSIEHPLNPWIPRLRGHETIVELSWEQTVASAESFHLIARQIQGMARYSRKSGACGLAGIPCQWGYKEREHGPDKGALAESYHKLGLLHFDVFKAVMGDPDVDLAAVLNAALRRRYGRKPPPGLVEHLLDSQHAKARSVNIRGVRATGGTLEEMHYQVFRYAPTFPDWRKRIERSPANVRRVIRENEANIAHARQILADIETHKDAIPAKAYGDFKASFEALLRLVQSSGNRRALLFLLWALKDRRLPFSITTVRQLERLMDAG